MSALFDVVAGDVRAGTFRYMDQGAVPSLYRNGKVYTRRDPDGSDSEWVGVDLVSVTTNIRDARNLSGPDSRTLEGNGFELLHRPLRDTAIDFLDHSQVVSQYYPQCTNVIREMTGAATVAAFDHNVRSATGKQGKQRIDGGQQVQGPARVVHGDYTLTSAPQRIDQLAQPPRVNDTWQPVQPGLDSLLNPDQVKDAIANGRFAIINLWRNIAAEPVATNPMALCDARTVGLDDLVVFELHYADRIGENYFARHSDSHRWYCYPAMTRDEALLITQWDSAGAIAASSGGAADSSRPDGPCTFSFHSAFEDPNTPDNAPDRWSIEVRCAILY